MINSARWLLKWIKQIFNLKLIKLSGVYKNGTKRAFVTHVLIKKLLLVKLNKKYSSFLWNFISIILVHKIRILFMHDTENMEIFSFFFRFDHVHTALFHLCEKRELHYHMMMMMIFITSKTFQIKVISFSLRSSSSTLMVMERVEKFWSLKNNLRVHITKRRR